MVTFDIADAQGQLLLLLLRHRDAKVIAQKAAAEILGNRIAEENRAPDENVVADFAMRAAVNPVAPHRRSRLNGDDSAILRKFYLISVYIALSLQRNGFDVPHRLEREKPDTSNGNRQERQQGAQLNRLRS